MTGFFYIKFLLTNLAFSLILGITLLRFNKKRVYSNLEIAMVSLGLGPIFTALILYYAFIIFPRQRYFFYIAAVTAIYMVLAVFPVWRFFASGGQGTLLKKGSPDLPKTFVKGNGSRTGKLAGTIVLIAFVGAFLYIYLGRTLKTPLEQHDALVYGNLGKLYAQKREIPYTKFTFPQPNGFVFHGSHKPSFSLLLTWEIMLNPREYKQKNGFDLYFRSITGYYGLMILVLLFMILPPGKRILAPLGVIVLFSGLQFLSMILNYHLDSYRIFFLLLSWIWLAYAIKNKDNLALFLLGAFSGFAAFTHLIGLAAALLNLAAYFLFAEIPLKPRLVKTAILTLLILVFGGFQYIMEILLGSISGFMTYL